MVANLVTIIATYHKGFAILIDPYPNDLQVLEPVLQLNCLDASIAISPIFNKFRNVILQSGTLSPKEMYSKVLNFTPKISKSFNLSLPRPALLPFIITKGAD